MRHRLSERKGQQGQALTEFIIVSTFVLIPLFLIVPVLAKLISQKQDVELGARYAAWERTVWYESAPDNGLDGYQGAGPGIKSDASVASEIDERIFARDDRAIYSSIDEQGYQLDPFSRRQNGNHLSMLESKAQDQATYAGSGSSNESAGGIGSVTDTVMDLISQVSRFDMSTKGFVKVYASLDLAFNDNLR